MRVAIIPARGGSKRIPRKNIRSFLGKPMISYSIAAARESRLFDQVVVSTEDPEIAAVAVDCGAQVPFLRPAELADDFSGTHVVVADAVRRLLDLGLPISHACCIYATAPMIRAADIQRGFDLLLESGAKSVFAATTFAFPIFRSFVRRSAGGLEMVFPEHFQTRSQDLPEAFHDAGQFYWARAEDWLSPPTGFGPDARIVQIPRWRCQDIDTEEDWQHAELLCAATVAGTGEPT